MRRAASSTGWWERQPSTRSCSNTRSAGAGAATRASQRRNPQPHKENRVFNTVAYPKKPLGLALAGVVAAVAVLTASLGTSTGRAAAPAAQQNIVGTAAAAGQFKTLLSLAKQAGLAGALS